MGGGSLLIPLSVLPADEVGARLAWALRWSLLPLFTSMTAIMGVANPVGYERLSIERDFMEI